jgi:hypothetical protein
VVFNCRSLSVIAGISVAFVPGAAINVPDSKRENGSHIEKQERSTLGMLLLRILATVA